MKDHGDLNPAAGILTGLGISALLWIPLIWWAL